MRGLRQFAAGLLLLFGPSWLVVVPRAAQGPSQLNNPSCIPGGACNPATINNRFQVDGVKYPTLFSCITAAAAVSGICDDRGLNNGSRVETQLANMTTATVLLGRGTYTFTSAAGGCFKIGSTSRLEGVNGLSGTVLVNNSNTDCISASVAANGTRGITIRNVDIRDGFGGGRTVGNGITIDGRTDEAEFILDNIAVSGHMDGIRVYRTIKSSMSNIECRANLNDGIAIYEVSTSLNVAATYCHQNTRHGYYVDGGSQYLTFQNTACDANTGDCYHFDTVSAQTKFITMNSPGVENNVGHGIFAKDIVGFVINAPKIAALSGTTKDGIHLEGAQGVVISGGESAGATGWSMNVITSSTPITPKDVYVFGTNLVAGVSGKLSDANGAVSLLQGNSWTLGTGTGFGFVNLMRMLRSGGAFGFPDIAGNGSAKVIIGDASFGVGLDGPITLNANLFSTNLLISKTAPTIAGAGCGGSGAAIPVANSTAAFKINVGTAPLTACTITMPAATTGWNCQATDITTNSTTVFYQKQTGAESTTSVTITNFSDVAAASNFTASDILKVQCHAD
jgi:hypothetical protein